MHLARKSTCLSESSTSDIRDFPRVVIIASNPLRRDMANGILLSSLFEGWPKERLAQIYFPVGLAYGPAFDVCREFSMIGTSGRVRRLVSPQHDSAEPGGSTAGEQAPSIIGTWKRHTLQRARRMRSLMHALKLGQEYWYAYSWLGPVLERELCHLRPDVVFADLGNFCLTRIICKACKRLGIPMHLHVGDDYVRVLYRGMPFERTLQSLSEYWFRQAVDYSDGRQTVNPIAVEAFASRYGGQWDWYTALVDPHRYDVTPRTPEETVRLVYTGSLGIGRWRSLRQLALLLQSLHKTHGIRAELDIYCSPEQLQAYQRHLHIAGVTNLRGWIPYAELPRVICDADILVHTESFDPEYSEIARYSFSTKLSDYLMTGRCILAFGPNDFAPMEVIRRAQAGITVDQSDMQHLESTLLSLLQDPARRESYGRAGRAWGVQWFSQRTRCEDFRRTLVNTVAKARMRNEPVATRIARAA